MTESDDLDEISVSVDATFSRHVADNALVFYMGRDIEIAFLQVWPSLKTFRPGSEQDERSLSSYTVAAKQAEVARIRCAPATAMQLAMTIIDDLLEAGKIQTDALKQNIETMIARNEKSVESGA